MSDTEILDFICLRIQEAAMAKGTGSVAIDGETLILGGHLPVDSLDLAAIVVELESCTGCDPFSKGFVDFRTVGELVRLYSSPK